MGDSLGGIRATGSNVSLSTSDAAKAGQSGGIPERKNAACVRARRWIGSDRIGWGRGGRTTESRELVRAAYVIGKYRLVEFADFYARRKYFRELAG